jgi:hypothetical protein
MQLALPIGSEPIIFQSCEKKRDDICKQIKKQDSSGRFLICANHCIDPFLTHFTDKCPFLISTESGRGIIKIPIPNGIQIPVFD